MDKTSLPPTKYWSVSADEVPCDESALTGESLPIRKTIEPQLEMTPLAERKSMLYRGSKITAGTGAGIAVGTGTQSEPGKISTMVSGASHHTTPLEKQLNRLGYRLVWVTISSIKKSYPRVEETPFDAVTRKMTTRFTY